MRQLALLILRRLLPASVLDFTSQRAAVSRCLDEGIDYERWAHLVRPASREAFADRLDVIELIED